MTNNTPKQCVVYDKDGQIVGFKYSDCYCILLSHDEVEEAIKDWCTIKIDKGIKATAEIINRGWYE